MGHGHHCRCCHYTAARLLLLLGGSSSKSLDFGATHGQAPFRPTLDEAFVMVGTTIGTISDPHKVVQVELPLEAREGSHVSKVLGKNLPGKGDWVVNDKGFAVS